MIRFLARNWRALALRGLWAILFGLVALVWPRVTLLALVVMFGAFVLIDGIFALVAVIRATERPARWWTVLIEGLAGIGVGVLTFVWPNITALVLLYLIAAWAMITGVFRIMAAIRLRFDRLTTERREITGEWLLILSGAVSALFGLLLAAFPGAGAVAVAWLIGIFALLFGALSLALAFRLRRWLRHTEA